MTKKEFCQQAIQNGFDGFQCKGWKWIKANLSELDYIFSTEEYKACDGMKYKCMPFLIGDDELSELEESVLETAWYLNNDRIHEQKRNEQIAKLNAMGFFNIENKEEYDDRKIEFIRDSSGDIFGGWKKYKGKLRWSVIDKSLMAMPTRHRRSGWWIDKDIFVKFL